MLDRLIFWALSSAVLIAVIFLLRTLLKRRMRPSLRYALWLPVPLHKYRSAVLDTLLQPLSAHPPVPLI